MARSIFDFKLRRSATLATITPTAIPATLKSVRTISRTASLDGNALYETGAFNRSTMARFSQSAGGVFRRATIVTIARTSPMKDQAIERNKPEIRERDVGSRS